MLEINIKEARSNFSAILERVENGEDIIITRRGKRIVRMTNLYDNPAPLSSLKDFRDNIDVTGVPLSQTVIIQREEDRY